MRFLSKGSARVAAAPPDCLEELQKASPASVFAELRTSADGLTTTEAAQRAAEHGPNALPEEKRSDLATLIS